MGDFLAIVFIVLICIFLLYGCTNWAGDRTRIDIPRRAMDDPFDVWIRTGIWPKKDKVNEAIYPTNNTVLKDELPMESPRRRAIRETCERTPYLCSTPSR